MNRGLYLYGGYWKMCRVYQMYALMDIGFTTVVISSYRILCAFKAQYEQIFTPKPDYACKARG
jgi:hypothetical protein